MSVEENLVRATGPVPAFIPRSNNGASEEYHVPKVNILVVDDREDKLLALEAILSDQSVELRQRGPAAADRYGRTMAHVTFTRDGAERSAAHELLAHGYARVAAQVGHPPCAAELLARERAARAARLGLWAGPHYGVLAAEGGAELLAERGRFAVAEGKLSIDDEVLKFFANEAPTNASNNLKAMRVRDLLMMSTGHQDEPPTAPDAVSAKSFLAQAVPHLPGTHFKYNTAATFMQSAMHI